MGEREALADLFDVLNQCSPPYPRLLRMEPRIVRLHVRPVLFPRPPAGLGRFGEGFTSDRSIAPVGHLGFYLRNDHRRSLTSQATAAEQGGGGGGSFLGWYGLVG